MSEPAAKKAKTEEAPKLKIALLQLEAGEDKAANIASTKKKIEEAASAGAKLICLPECWNSPYGTGFFAKYAEPLPAPGGAPDEKDSPSTAMLVQMAKEHKVYICGGSIPEKLDGKLYNAGVAIDDEGAILAKYRKVHLFDIDIPGKITFKESDVLTAGDNATVFNSPWGKIGVAICYDMRFPELAMIMRDQGAKMIIYPGAFNTTTGPKNYELLARGRAVDNQCFVIAVSPSRVPGAAYQAWGHSTVVDPWGQVMQTCEHEPCIVYADLDFDVVETFRANVPISKQKRADIYTLGQRS